MSSTTAPYATLKDAPQFEKRTGDVRAPWFRDPPPPKSLRVKDPLPYITSNAKTAPFATFHNVPKESEILKRSAPSSGQHPRPTTNGSQSPQQKKLRAPFGTSNDIVRPRTKANLAKVHQAPWDRSDRKLDHPVQPTVSKVHPPPWDRNDEQHKVTKVPLKVPNLEVASSKAPFAMHFKQG